MAVMHLNAPVIPPSSQPLPDCAWCWYAEHPGEPFPEQWSSTICAGHEAWQLARLAESRARRRQVGFILIGEPQPAPQLRRHRRSRRRYKSNYPNSWPKVAQVLKHVARYRCERCGAEGDLSVHHVGAPFADGRPGDPRDKHDLRRENLQVLCRSCHANAECEQSERDLEWRIDQAWRRAYHIYLVGRFVGTGLVALDTQAQIPTRKGMNP